MERWVLPVVGGTLTALSFPDAGLWLFAWFALVPLLLAIRTASPGQAFRRGLLFAFSGFMVDLAWLRHTMEDYGGIPLWLSIIFLALLALYCAAFPALSVYLAKRVQRRAGVPMAVSLPVSWVAFEYFRGHFISGFPWNSLGQSQYAFSTILQNADWGSYYGISFLLVLVNCGFSEWISKGFTFRTSRQLHAALSVTLLFLMYGAFRLHGEPPRETIRVGIVQGNIDQHEKWNSGAMEKNLERHIALTSNLLSQSPDIVIWPEAALTFYYRFGWRYKASHGGTLGERLHEFVVKTGVPIVTGTLDRIDDKVYNAACLISPNRFEEYYYKTHLVPFGEYVPFRRILFFVNRLVISAIGDFDVGRSAQPLRFGKAALGMTICYENIFPHLVRRRVLAGADVICNITNDAWFGRSWAAEQHFSASVFRAVEFRRPVVRAANTGISGAVDRFGTVMRRTPLFTTAAFVVDVAPEKTLTIYARWGDFFAWSCILAALYLYLLSLRGLWKKRRSKGGNNE